MFVHYFRRFYIFNFNLKKLFCIAVFFTHHIVITDYEKVCMLIFNIRTIGNVRVPWRNIIVTVSC